MAIFVQPLAVLSILYSIFLSSTNAGVRGAAGGRNPTHGKAPLHGYIILHNPPYYSSGSLLPITFLDGRGLWAKVRVNGKSMPPVNYKKKIAACDNILSYNGGFAAAGWCPHWLRTYP